jgi:hypothetical protein
LIRILSDIDPAFCCVMRSWSFGCCRSLCYFPSIRNNI